ncbi:hypothetical protein Tsubulata_009400 [Turnera subulata]|uniref:Pentacotripeptide-repeat region of PRORP domain-containing protein n=1 Tax=Turnera subulata TaxID=218843 RepID=A0A9Q0G2G2_9ROSI|nr:hypothetical protein Tsubulata_009400 [Turnera subulata]
MARIYSAVTKFISAGKLLRSFCSTTQGNQFLPGVQELCEVVSSSIGGLDELESTLNRLSVPLTSPLVRQVMGSCKHEAPSRRLLRFFLWLRKNLDSDIKDEDFNFALRILAEKKDSTGVQILVSDLQKEGRVMEVPTFAVVAEALVKAGKEDDALGIFKHLDKFKCPQDGVTVTAIVDALCAKGHAKKAQEVVLEYKDKLSGEEKRCIYRSLLYGWSVKLNVKDSRKIIQEMKEEGIVPDLFCYNTFLRCLCERNLKCNPSGLVPETLNVMMEMRHFRIEPNVISYNVLLSCLGRTRRVKEACGILEKMKRWGCAPNWVSYYLVAKVLYLTGRFGKGNKMVDEMMEAGLVPDHKFYYDLIGVLCGVERVNFALGLFEKMKKSSLGGYGPVYDVLIPKLCRGGDFEKGRELWDEASNMGVPLSCSKDVLDPSITKVFRHKMRLDEEEVSVKESTGDGNSSKKGAWKKKARE